MTIMAHKVEFKHSWANSTKEMCREAIHSGHFMVSSFEAEAQDDEDEVAVPVPEEEIENKTIAVISRSQHPAPTNLVQQPSKFPWNRLSIETSLTKLFQCMSLAYRQKLTSPKWNRFKGIRLRWKDKIRLNNVIWRCWHMQFIKKKHTLVCQFASPLDADTHNKPEAIVLEGKYWKRKLNAVTAEYKKWRLYSHNQILGKPNKDSLDLLAELEGQDWQVCAGDNAMMVDEDYMGLMSDTLFSTITANQPFAFPDTREIARGVNLADFIQPSLVQLQPNLYEFMDIEPLDDFLCTRLSTVPEEPTIEPPTSQSYQPSETRSLRTSPPSHSLIPQASSYPPQPPQYADSPSLWYLPSSTSYETSVSSGQPAPPQYTSPRVIPTPPPPPPAPAPRASRGRKEDVPTPTKTKKNRSRSEGSKKLASPNSTVISQTSTAASSIQPTGSQIQPNNALLAQLLTNAPSSSYNFLNEEQSCSSVKPALKEEVTFLQQQPYKPIENSGLMYHSESDLSKQSFLIKSESNSNSSPTSHCSPIPSPLCTSVIIKPLQSPVGNQPGTSASCPESPLCQESLSLSPLNVGSPTSLSCKPAYREHRRVCHINAEQKRRCNIKNGFDMLHSLIPMLNQNPNIKMSKAAMLQKGAEYIMQLQNESHQLKQEMDSLKQQIETLNSEISNCQAMLPATGAPISKLGSNKMRDMYRKYVRTRVHENWKFWILSLICEPLLETFSNLVSTASMDDLYRTTLQWVDQHCSLVNLRPIVLNALKHLCTSTEILTEPARLPMEAKAATEKSSKKS